MKIFKLWFILFVVSCFSVNNGLGVGFCPSTCQCRGHTVRCHTGNLDIPRGIPSTTKKLYLSGSKIKYLSSLKTLPHLTSLSLANTGLVSIHPESLSECRNLQSLDLSYNNLSQLTGRFLHSIKSIKILQVNNNKLACLDPAIAKLVNLQVLNLQNNQLTSIPQNAFRHMTSLRQLRLDGNSLHCSCGVEWLATYLRKHPDLGIGTICSTPKSHSRRSISTFLSHQLTCSEKEKSRSQKLCIAKSVQCPTKCKCSQGTVDCRSLGLNKIPSGIPYDTIELRLEKNLIESIPPYAFYSAPNLKRIDISRNFVAQVSKDAFKNNKKLTTLIFYDNLIEEIPEDLFLHLKDLHMILLNKNKLSCISEGAFRDQTNLVLLSLFDNNLESLPQNLFINNTNLRTLHLGLNPWDCGCHLSWLTHYLKDKGIETSAAMCKSPDRYASVVLSSVKRDEACSVAPSNSGTCHQETSCPSGCKCSTKRVDCSGLKLLSLPELPKTIHHLKLDRNNIRVLKNLCETTPSLRTLSLKNNNLDEIKPETFKHCRNLEQLDLTGNHVTALKSGSLAGLEGLKALDLSGNRLVCLENGSLAPLKKLKQLNLPTTYIPCNCQNQWLESWLQEAVASKNSFNCKIICSDGRDVRNICDLSHCPSQCICKDKTVRCEQQNLQNFPTQVSSTTKQIYLGSNKISRIEREGLRELVNLQLLDLSNNEIEYIDSSSFPDLPLLQTILLSFNKIRCISAGSMLGLSGLRVLSLGNNDISGISREAFGDANNINHIALGSNPLHCDCKLQWLSTWLKDGKEAGTAQCSSPAILKGKSLISIPSYYFYCKDSTSPVDSKCSPCYTSPCLNGGFCISDHNNIHSDYSIQFRCECTPSYRGDRCQFEVDACYGSPCRNNGTCSLQTKGSFKCNCQDGYEGRVCETRVSYCRKNKCQNQASCVSNFNSYECTCPVGFQGKFCQNRVSIPLSYYCTGHLCQNGGECTPGAYPGNYSCKCRPPYSGKFCQVEPHVSVMYQRTSRCAQNDCQHGICQENREGNSYVCICHSGYTGKRCEYLTTVQYRNSDSYTELDPLYTARPVNITMVIKTTQPAGVLLYHGNRNHLAVELFHGRIRASLDVGNHPVSTMFSYATLNDDLEHKVQIQLKGKSLVLSVDGGQPRTVVNEGSNKGLSLIHPTFIGGVPSSVGETALSLWHLRNSTSFKGCIKEFYLEDKLIDFLQAARKRNAVEAGCFTRQLGMPPVANLSLDRKSVVERKFSCRQNKCNQKGTRKCSSKDRKTYQCKCKRGWDGRYCEKAPTCRKQKQRRTIQENNCRSRRQVSTKKCLGGCHDGTCCKAKKVKKRKIGMICNDGTRYVKLVTTVRKCSCIHASKCSL